MGVRGQRHAPAALYPRERTTGTHCTGGWVGPRAGLDIEATGKIFSPLPGIEPRPPGRPASSQTLYWLSYPGFESTHSNRKMTQLDADGTMSEWTLMVAIHSTSALWFYRHSSPHSIIISTMCSLHNFHEINAYRAMSVRIQLENWWTDLDVMWCRHCAIGVYHKISLSVPYSW
jgi:hypothetical protein